MTQLLERAFTEASKLPEPEQDVVAALLLSELHSVSEMLMAARPAGLCAGEFVVPDDFDAPLPENVLSDFESQ